jgi:hypothetical protein
MSRIEPATLDLPLSGLNLPADTLGRVLAMSSRTLLVFVRHYGCLFCREMLKDLRAVRAADAGYPSVVVFGQGDLDESSKFFDKFWPDVPVVCDPAKRFYDAFGLGQGSAYQMFGPRVWACGIRAAVKGNLVGKPVGDPWTMPGVFLASADGELLWKHEFAHAGDHPDWRLLARVGSAAAQVAPA